MSPIGRRGGTSIDPDALETCGRVAARGGALVGCAVGGTLAGPAGGRASDPGGGVDSAVGAGSEAGVTGALANAGGGIDGGA
jgi:hypothetical protein